MTVLPEDPMILFSFINTKLRDNYASLDELCDDMHISKVDLVAKLGRDWKSTRMNSSHSH